MMIKEKREQQEVSVCDFHECEHGEKFRDAISSANLNRFSKS